MSAIKDYLNEHGEVSLLDDLLNQQAFRDKYIPGAINAKDLVGLGGLPRKHYKTEYRLTLCYENYVEMSKTYTEEEVIKIGLEAIANEKGASKFYLTENQIEVKDE